MAGSSTMPICGRARAHARAAGSPGAAEIAATRGVPVGVECVSPSKHSAFSTPVGLLEFVARLRELMRERQEESMRILSGWIGQKEEA